jgi:broad specificity phosphatase PhoE
MKIGLVRHFKVDLKREPFMTSESYNQYMSKYEETRVIPNELVVDKQWDKCYCSSMQRAITTAKTIYHGDIIISDRLIEISFVARINTKIPLPYHFWTLINRIAWFRDHISQPEGRTKVLKRINEIINEIVEQKDQNILIVSHAGALYEIQKILRRKGFKGHRFVKARNGRLYVMDNDFNRRF